MEFRIALQKKTFSKSFHSNQLEKMTKRLYIIIIFNYDGWFLSSIAEIYSVSEKQLTRSLNTYYKNAQDNLI